MVSVEGGYDEAGGAYIYRFAKDGTVTIKYQFAVTSKGACDPRQIGVVFRLPRQCDTLTWRRKAQWSFYPHDHIGRAEGTATALVKDVPLSGLAGPRTQPAWSWSADANRYGCNDFRSTKMNVFEAALLSPGGNGLRLLGDGSQHVRSWLADNAVSLLVAEYSNHGAPPFFCEFTIPWRPLKPGSVVSGTVRMEIR